MKSSWAEIRTASWASRVVNLKSLNVRLHVLYTLPFSKIPVLYHFILYNSTVYHCTFLFKVPCYTIQGVLKIVDNYRIRIKIEFCVVISEFWSRLLTFGLLIYSKLKFPSREKMVTQVAGGYNCEPLKKWLAQKMVQMHKIWCLFYMHGFMLYFIKRA